jgi:hypothetical protein
MTQCDRQTIRLRRMMGAFALLLVGATWPLWMLSPAPDNPQIPWLATLCEVPFWADRIALAAALIGAARMTFQPRSLPASAACWPLALFVGGLASLTLLDQARLQPWVWLFLLQGPVCLLAGGCTALACCRALVVSVYVYSALSKFDAAFGYAHGQLLLNGLLQPLRVDDAFWPLQTKTLLASLFPLGELLIASFLVFPRTWRLGLSGSVVMHLLLIWTLGVGLGHEGGVLIWNAYFIAQNVVLFGRQPRGENDKSPILNDHSSAAAPAHQPPSKRRLLNAGGRLAVAWTLFGLAFPLLTFVGRCDHWLAWEVYSSRPEQVRVLIAADVAARLPESLQPFLGPPAPLSEQVPLSLDGWSFAKRRCPIYPQLRYRLALVTALLEGKVPDGAVHIEIGLSPNRRTGERERLQLEGLVQVRDYCRRFLVNTQARE